MEARLSIITLGVEDLDRSRKFYSEGLGFPIAKMSDANIVFFKTSGVCLALYPAAGLAEDAKLPFSGNLPDFRGVTLAHNTKSKEEVDQILQAAQSAGGRILKPAEDTSWGGYSGYFADPDGHAWEVAYADFWQFDENGNLVFD
jgi:hypothetical protein